MREGLIVKGGGIRQGATVPIKGRCEMNDGSRLMIAVKGEWNCMNEADEDAGWRRRRRRFFFLPGCKTVWKKIPVHHVTSGVCFRAEVAFGLFGCSFRQDQKCDCRICSYL